LVDTWQNTSAWKHTPHRKSLQEHISTHMHDAIKKNLRKKREREEIETALHLGLRFRLTGWFGRGHTGKIVGRTDLLGLDHHFLRWARPILLPRLAPYAIAAVQSSTGNF
jgi:hypothetical protein